MNRGGLFLAGLGMSALACRLWNSWPGHEAFRLMVLKLTSPTGEAEKSPLAFVEHYHFGLASLAAGRYAGGCHALFDGFGAGMIVSEAAGSNPFGYGKTVWEVKGNLSLASFLSGLLLALIAIHRRTV